MKESKIRFNTKGFRAINSAEMIINGITVVAGENGCGKSTLSKLLYYSYKTISNYDNLVAKKLSSELQNVFTFFKILKFELFDKKYKNIDKESLEKRLKVIEDIFSENEINEELKDMIILLINDYSNIIDRKSSPHLTHIVNDIVKNKGVKENTDQDLFETISAYVESLFKESFGLIESRAISLFKNELKNVFHNADLPSEFSLYEYGNHLVSIDKNSISIPYAIDNVIYIDSPMMIGVNSDENKYWKDLNSLLLTNKSDSNSNCSDIIKNEILKGDVALEDNKNSLNKFSFKRDDGSVFNLLDCATGIKSFSILQLLLKNGSISDKTLLIIDEPESHLHPQWIIEYARMIVLLHKEVGVKFFIASHNPDMVSAIRLISEKEDILNNVDYYLAEKSMNYTYDYKYLNIDIDPIFESFNIAIERIGQYGGGDEF
tara:strand:+ start:978 stop:2276 length:1299 start_codon:yes stop_codon:yes gene_type:complete